MLRLLRTDEEVMISGGRERRLYVFIFLSFTVMPIASFLITESLSFRSCDNVLQPSLWNVLFIEHRCRDKEHVLLSLLKLLLDKSRRR